MGQVQSAVFRNESMPPITFAGDAPATLTAEIFEAATLGDVELLADLIDASFFDLSTLDSTTRETLLHRALSCAHDNIVVMLLDRAGGDPLILDAKDGEGYTPLMRATAQGNVRMMQTLVKYGAQSDNNVDVLATSCDFGASLKRTKAEVEVAPKTWEVDVDLLVREMKARYDDQLGGRHFQQMDAHRYACTAQLLVIADGDLATAFEMAVERGLGYAEEFYFNAQASTVPAIKNLPCPQAVTRMVDKNCIRSDDILMALEWAQQTENHVLVAQLTSYPVVNSILKFEMGQRPDGAKVAVLKRFVAFMGDRSRRLVDAAITNCHQYGRGGGWSENSSRSIDFKHVNLLFAAGANCGQLLMRICEESSPAIMRQFAHGVLDFDALVRTLPGTIGALNSESVINTLMSAVVKDLLENNKLSSQAKISALKALPLEHARRAVTQIMLDQLKHGQSLEYVRLLVEGGASTIDVFEALATENDRSALRKLISIGGNYPRAIRELLDRDKRGAAHALAVAVALEKLPAESENPGKSMLQT